MTGKFEFYTRFQDLGLISPPKTKRYYVIKKFFTTSDTALHTRVAQFLGSGARQLVFLVPFDPVEQAILKLGKFSAGKKRNWAHTLQIVIQILRIVLSVSENWLASRLLHTNKAVSNFKLKTF